MASTYEQTRAVIISQNAGYGVFLYAGEENFAGAKGSGGVLRDTNLGKWIFANFPSGALCIYCHQDDVTLITVAAVAAGTITRVAVTNGAP